MADLLKKAMEGWRVSLFGDRLHVITDEEPEQVKQGITAVVRSNGIRVSGPRERRFCLEDVFISVVETARQQKRPFITAEERARP